MCDGLLLLVTAAHVEHVRVCCGGSLGELARRQSPLLSEHVQQHCGLCFLATSVASVVACCNRSVSTSLSGVVGRPCGLVSRQWGRYLTSLVSHRCSWSMCTCVVASLVERAIGPGCSMPVGPVSWWPVWARVVPVWACVVPRGRCRVRGPLVRMHCGCGLRIRCEGQPHGRCLVSCSLVRLCRCGSGVSVLPQKNATYRN